MAEVTRTVDELEAARRKLRAMNLPGYAASGIRVFEGDIVLHVREQSHLTTVPQTIDGVSVVSSVISQTV